MRERNSVKFKVNMFEDTKFKIIDTKPERDTIHYVWSRLLLLAGKVNREGELYLSKNIPYTIETLAVEFNRDCAQIKLAIDLFIELEMVEFTEDKIYIVKNFAKHQNIKIKEKSESKDKENNIDKADDTVNEKLIVEINENVDKESNNKINEKDVKNIEETGKDNLEIPKNDVGNIENKIKDKKVNYNLKGDAPVPFKAKKCKQANKKNKRDTGQEICVIDEEIEDNTLCSFTDGIRTLGAGENAILEFSFG